MVQKSVGFLRGLGQRRALVALLAAGDAESAAVLTPYNGQVRLIRGILKARGGDLYNKARTALWNNFTGDWTVVNVHRGINPW